MPRKRTPILGRARALLNKNLLLFKGSKRFHLIKHYNYGFMREFEFSPSNTPLFRYPWRPVIKKKGKRFLSLFLCGGNGAESSYGGGWGDELEVISMVGDRSEQLNEEEEVEVEVSVDQRAERFIQKFYEEMKIQRRRSM